jgi:hypothetical protein
MEAATRPYVYNPKIPHDWWRTPPEPPEDGCPASWAQSPFVFSVQDTARRRTEGGDRVQSPRFDALLDRVAQEAALTYEAEQDRVIDRSRTLLWERRERERNSG